MLKKLLKYDLKYMIKSMSIFYILTIFFAILTRVLFEINPTTIITIISRISLGCLIAMMVDIIINTMFRSWVGFTTSLYKDESYLTHTLPVSKKDIFESKFIQTFIFLLVGFLVMVIGLFIAFYSKENWIVLKEFFNTISTNFNISTLGFSIAIIFIFFLEIFNGILSGYLGIILGNRKNNNKVAFSVLFGFVTYILSQCIVLLALFIFGLFNPDIMNLFTSNTFNNIDILRTLVVFPIIVYVILLLLISIISIKYLNKGVNVE